MPKFKINDRVVTGPNSKFQYDGYVGLVYAVGRHGDEYMVFFMPDDSDYDPSDCSYLLMHEEWLEAV